MMKRTAFTVLLTLLFVFTLYAQEQKKDTLYFKLDGEYVNQSLYVPNSYLLEDTIGHHSGIFYFQATDTLFYLKPKKVLCLKEFVRSSKFYNKHNTKKLDDYRLWEYLDRYQVFLIKEDENKTYYLDVYASFVIE